MNRAIQPFAPALALTLLSIAASADDAGSDRPIEPHQRLMRECMTKERQVHPDIPDAARKKTCSAKIDSFEQHPSETQKPPDNPVP